MLAGDHRGAVSQRVPMSPSSGVCMRSDARTRRGRPRTPDREQCETSDRPRRARQGQTARLAADSSLRALGNWTFAAESRLGGVLGNLHERRSDVWDASEHQGTVAQRAHDLATTGPVYWRSGCHRRKHPHLFGTSGSFRPARPREAWAPLSAHSAQRMFVESGHPHDTRLKSTLESTTMTLPIV